MITTTLDKNLLSIRSNKDLTLYLENVLLKEYDEYTRRFVYYVYNRSIKEKEYYVEIHSKVITKIFKKKKYQAKIRCLIADGIIKFDKQYIVDKKCYGYRLTDDFYGKIRSKQEFFPKVLFSTDTKKKVRIKKMKTSIYDENRNRIGEIIIDALHSMKGRINYPSLLQFESDVECFIDHTSIHSYPGHYEYLHRLQRLIDGIKIYLYQQEFNQEEGNFELGFNVSSSGRIFGNFQNMPRRLKHVLYDGFRNYDISNSQINILLNLLKANRLKHECFQEYVDDKGRREIIARRLDITIPQWKEAIFTVLFGGRNSDHPSSEFHKTIGRQMPNEMWAYDDEKTKKEFRKRLARHVNKELKPFKAELKDWTDFLAKEYIPAHTKKNINNEPYIPNCLGQNLFYEKFENKSGEIIKHNKDGSLNKKVLNKISAHIIQGIESSFIYHVTKLTTDIDDNVIVSNDFDGFCCTKEISEKVIQLAREKSGFNDAQFVLKPIDDEFDEFMQKHRDRHYG
jgi:hypothetical protein